MNLQQISGRIQEIFTDVSRAVDRSIRIVMRRGISKSRTPTYSWGRADYDYWNRLYWCKVEGLELSGLFVKPIVSKIAAWTLGKAPKFVFNSKRLRTKIETWWDLHHAEILEAYRGALTEADAFFIINADMSITTVPPDCVNPIVDPNDYGLQIGWSIRQVFPHPDNTSKKMIVVDDYYKDRRVHRVEFSDGRQSTKIYENLIGVIPVVHIANQKKRGEHFGHPEAEGLIELLHRYGQTLEAATEGNILQGRPTPVLSFSQLADLNAFWRRYGRRDSVKRSDGTTQTVETLSVDMSELLTISGATFDYKSPGSFLQDTERLLGLDFYLLLEHLELPEFSFGNAIEGSKASAETQMPVLEIFIRMKQRDCTPWILETVKIVEGYLSITNPGLPKEDPTLQWNKLTQNGRLVLDAIAFGKDHDLLDDRTALISLPLDIERPDDVLKEAKKEAEVRDQKMMDQQEAQMKMAAENQPPSPGGSDKNRTTSKKPKVSEMDPDLEEELEIMLA